MPSKIKINGRTGNGAPTKKKHGAMRPSRIWLKISTPRSVSTAMQPSATPAMLAAARHLISIMSSEPEKTALHWRFKENADVKTRDRTINLCAATQEQIEREGSIILKPSKSTCEHCDLIGRMQGVP